jgi:hypothetical protein
MSKDEPIIYKISEFQKTQVIRNRHILMKTMETLLLCGKQNIAIRGHTPERSNFTKFDQSVTLFIKSFSFDSFCPRKTHGTQYKASSFIEYLSHRFSVSHFAERRR